MNADNHIFSVIVHNEPGVLSRVSGLLTQRGFNIKSLSVGEMADRRYSRMTITVEGDEIVMEQVRKQLARQVEVIKVRGLAADRCRRLEMAMIKIKADPAKRAPIIETVGRFLAEIIDAGPTELVIAAVGSPERISGFVESLRPHGIIDLARTGQVAMADCRKGDRQETDRRTPVPTMSSYFDEPIYQH